MLTLLHPWLFLALLAAAAALLALGARRSLAELTPTQCQVCFAVRAALLACLALALAGMRWQARAGDELHVLFLVDASASISPEAAAQARDFVEKSIPARRRGDRAGVLGFARETRLWQPATEDVKLLTRWPQFSPAERAGTDIGRALDFAAAVAPNNDGAARRVVLLSDGNDTADGARAAAARLAASAGAELWTVPLRNPFAPEALVRALDVPRGVQPNAPFDLRADVRSNVETRARVNLYANGFLLAQQEAVALHPGRNEIVFPNVRATGGFTNYEVEIAPELDTLAENNRARATVALAGPPRVLLIDSDEEKLRPLAGALRAEKIDVETRGLSGLPRTLEDLQHFDLFLLSDVSALRLTREQMELYRNWVSELGGGFALLGGENSFGVGGYFRTPLETLLPVRMEHDDRQETPNVALLVVLDRSGSMSARVGDNRTKIALADEGAALALDVLGPRDLFGLTAVDTVVHNVVPLDRVSGMNKAALAQRIAGIDAGGGGIYIYTSLVDALRVLRGAEAKIKHCILFSDAADAEEKVAGEMGDSGTPAAASGGAGTSQDVVAAMRGARITTSVVGLGGERDKDVPFLKNLAEIGGGRFYLTDDARNLPQIFSTETMKVAQSSLVEEPFQARALAPSAITAGIDWNAAPLLLGFNATKPKPTAEILLTTETGEPLLATWRYGLGQVAAFTSDAKARWAAEWLGWPGYGKFWVQLARALLRQRDAMGANAADLQVRATELGDGARLRLDIDALTPAGGFRDGLTLNAALVETDAAGAGGVTRTAEQVGPGTYRVELPLPSAAETTNATLAPDSENANAAPAASQPPSPPAASGSNFLISISSPDLPRPFVFGHARAYPREYLETETNETLLRELAELGHGRFAPAPTEIFTQRAASVPGLSRGGGGRQHELAGFFLAMALVLLPIDIFLRRRTWRETVMST